VQSDVVVVVFVVTCHSSGCRVVDPHEGMERDSAQETDSHALLQPAKESPQPQDVDPPVAAAVAEILDAKKHGIHYNEELAESRSFNNPAQFMQLVESLELDQYGSNLDKGVWNPHGFEASDYLDGPHGLREQEHERKAREHATRTRIDFRPATSLNRQVQ